MKINRHEFSRMVKTDNILKKEMLINGQYIRNLDGIKNTRKFVRLRYLEKILNSADLQIG